MRIAVVGAGRVGTALAVQWLLAGHDIAVAMHSDETRRRHDKHLAETPLIAADEAARTADVVVLGVPDAEIESVCRELAAVLHEGQTVAHLSGASSLDAIASGREVGASTLSLHPLHTFPDVRTAIRRMQGCPIAVTAEDEDTAALGERLAREAGGEPFRLDDDAKPLYHAAAVFASNYLVTVVAEAEALFSAVGLPDPVEAFMPLARASLENVATLGPGPALTGPVVRGDAETVRRNLDALALSAPNAVNAYVTLARLAVRLASRSGRLDDAGRAAVEEVLDAWSG